MRGGRRIRRALGAVLLASAMPVASAGAQADSVTIVANPHYTASGVKAALLGRDYRDLWTAPIRVPVLDLTRHEGGLTPVERGGGLQTVSLRFRAPDGREFNFRSVDKDQGGGMHPDFQDTFVDRMAQDQVSSKHPASGPIAAVLLEAAGVLHPTPVLYVMPDDPRLGEFRADFAGMLGSLEIHASELGDGQPGFAGSTDIESAENFLEELEESPENRVEAREYLRARLMDIYMGDWDRHIGQWRFARFDRDGVSWWRPIPEDRDNAFASYDGLLMSALRGGTPNLVTFGETYPSIFGLTENAQILDRQLLSELPVEAYLEVAAELQQRLTDEVIRRAVASSPPAYGALRGEELTRALQARREALPAAAEAFYRQLAREVDVMATDEPELAVAEVQSDGSVELRLHSDPANPREPHFRRRFIPGQTRDVRVYLRGGDDRAVIRGDGPGTIHVRFIGGGGDDVLADSTAGLGFFYDDRGENRFLTARGTVVDERPFEAPEPPGSGFNDNAPPFRDWGLQVQWFRPFIEWRYNAGPVIGGGPEMTRYGFRRAPYAQKVSLRGLYAPLHTRFGVELDGEFRQTNSPAWLTLRGHATQLEVTRFHGYGNQTSNEGSSDRYKVWETEYRAAVALHRAIGERGSVYLGPEVRYTRPELEDGGPAEVQRPFGSEPFGQVGALAGIELDSRDRPAFPRRGLHLEATATAYPEIWDAPGAFGGVGGTAATYLPVPLPLETTLAVRAGGDLAWGDFPFQQAAFLGGSRSLRGTPRQRFAGEAAAFAGAELRTFLTRFNFISRGDLGIIGLADAGRVFVDGDDSDRIHTGFGGGFWVAILDRTRSFSIVYAQGTEQAVYFRMGMPF